MTDLEYTAWLNDRNATRVVLAEVVASVAGVDTTFYFATEGYNTGALDTPPNQHYQPALSKDLTLTESLSIDTYVASISIGDMGIENTNGVRDHYRGYVWSNRPNRLYLGGPAWARADFRLIYDGVTEDIGSKSRDLLGLKLRDKLLRLNTAVTEATMGSGTTDPDAVRPNSLGELFNMTPRLVSGVTYTAHDGIIEDIPEVRDEGLPVTYTKDLATGRFTLARAPAGAITCDVQGDKPSGTYNNTVSTLVQRLVTGYGKVADRFTTGDLDTAQLATFDAAHPQPVGMAILDRMNVLNACRDLAGSVGAQLSMSRLGKLRLLKISAPGTSVRDVRDYHMAERNLWPMTRLPVVAAVKLGFNKNWTPQEGLTTALSAADKELFASPGPAASQDDATVATLYKLSTETEQQDTMLLKRTDANAEALRRLNLRKVPREVFQFTAYAEMFDLELGNTITLYYPRFGLDAGVPGVVVSLSSSWAKNRIIVQVLI